MLQTCCNVSCYGAYFVCDILLIEIFKFVLNKVSTVGSQYGGVDSLGCVHYDYDLLELKSYSLVIGILSLLRWYRYLFYVIMMSTYYKLLCRYIVH
jgi:hypothetical protein